MSDFIERLRKQAWCKSTSPTFKKLERRLRDWPLGSDNDHVDANAPELMRLAAVAIRELRAQRDAAGWAGEGYDA